MMNAQLFPDLPEQREGQITVDGRTLAQCPACRGIGLEFDQQRIQTENQACWKCNGGGVVLVRTPCANDVWVHVQSRKQYRVLGIATVSGTFTSAVLYQLSTNLTAVVWALPVQDWFKETSPGKPRFELVSPGHKP